MEEAMADQRYIDVAEVAHLADGVARLLGKPPPHTGRTAETPAKPVSMPAVSPALHETPRKTSSRKAQKDKEYPSFERDGNRLVKVGWSKKHRVEYEHRAPREAVASLVRHLTETIADGQIFVVEELMPVSAFDGGSEIPAYQVYLTLKWLQRIGFVQKKGRDGYILQGSELMSMEFEELWKSIPERAHQKSKGR